MPPAGLSGSYREVPSPGGGAAKQTGWVRLQPHCRLQVQVISAGEKQERSIGNLLEVYEFPSAPGTCTYYLLNNLTPNNLAAPNPLYNGFSGNRKVLRFFTSSKTLL